jgi:hypothetical protein
MVEWARWFLSALPLFVLAAICTHLVVSISQTLFHYGLGHHRIGGIFYRNHIRFHHKHYADGHLVSPIRCRNEGNNTPYFLIPTIFVVGAMFLALPFDLFLVVIPRSHDNPEFLWVDDPEVVRDLIAPGVPVPCLA